MVDRRTVALAPRIDLHTGYHGAICAFPPTEFDIRPVDATHVFVMQDDGGSPHQEAHLGEFIEVEGSPSLVHTARWPVLGAGAWVADTDDLLYPILCGRTANNPSFRAVIRGNDPEMTRLLRYRAENMLAAYLHPSCTGILLRGHPGTMVSTAKQWFERLGVSAIGDGMLEKVTIVRPAQKAADVDSVRTKWASSDPLRILFCGRDFEVKNGLLALEVMSQVKRRNPEIEFTYVGRIPADLREGRPDLLHGVTHHEQMDHASSLRAMRAAHILFHPSRFENIGIALLEAMGAGAAVISARGQNMDYIDELFADGGALLVDRDRIHPHQEAEMFEKLMLKAVGNVAAIRTMGLRNHEATAIGPYSIEAQRIALARAYRNLSCRPGTPLTLSDLPHTKEFRILRLLSADVMRDCSAMRRRHQIGPGYQAIMV